MSIFAFKEGKVAIEPLNLTIPELKIIFDRDKSKDKSKAYKDLNYIYHMSDFKSPYNNLDAIERKEQIIKDYYPDGFEEDIEINVAISKYIKLNTTPSMRLLMDARAGVEKIRNYYKEVDLNETDDNGKKVNRLSEISTSLANLGKMVDSIDKLEERVKKEISISSKIRGDKEISEFERE